VIVRTLGIQNSVQWRKNFKKLSNLNLHSTPERYYKGKGWKGWADFLGTSRYL
jgi:hypothetical protein